MTVTVATLRTGNGTVITLDWDKHEGHRVSVTSPNGHAKTHHFADYETARETFFRSARLNVTQYWD